MQPEVLWQTVLGEIELGVSRASFITWFKQTKLLKLEENELTVGVPNIFAKQQLEVKYNQLIQDTLAKNGLQNAKVNFKIHSGTAVHRKVTDQNIVIKNETAATSQPTLSVTHSYRQGLNERYTFASFIVGGGNELAYAAAQAICLKPGTKYNPLYVYGGVGIGKTHLMQAIGNEIQAKNKNAKVVYVTCEQFVQEFLDAIRYKKAGDFANHYRSADVLIVDDLQFIVGKEKTQEEFFHTFNTLHQANKQIILSSDRPPKSIPTLEERLRTRFEWGMTVDMQAPDFETRCAIVQTKASQHGIRLEPAVVELIANQSQHNVRELEGAMNQLLAFCEMRNLSPDFAVAQAMFGVAKTRPKHLSAKGVVEKTAKYYQIDLEEMLGPKRDKEIVFPRQVAMYLLRSELHLSFPKIAHELGRKDHTTAIHSVDKIEKEIVFDPGLKQSIDEIKERLYV